MRGGDDFSGERGLLQYRRKIRREASLRPSSLSMGEEEGRSQTVGFGR